MRNVRAIGLDVHERSIMIAVADSDGSAPSIIRKIDHDTPTLIRALKDLSARSDVHVVYEAGAAGFELQRRLEKAGFKCSVIAPSKVPRDGRQKTDAEDAIRLARFLRSGDLTAIHVPERSIEVLREVTRCREDALKIQQGARSQLRNFLIRHGRRYSGKSTWTKQHLTWIAQQKFDSPALALVRDDYLREVELVAARISRLTKDVEDLAESSPHKPLFNALQALRGVQLLTAVTLVAEIGNFERFSNARQLMSYVGLVPRESSSGEKEWRGSITRAGNAHARRVLGEAAWNYRFLKPSKPIEARRRLASSPVQAIATKAEARLSGRFRTLMLRRKETNKIVVAVARELAGFVWAIGRQATNEMKAA